MATPFAQHPHLSILPPWSTSRHSVHHDPLVTTTIPHISAGIPAKTTTATSPTPPHNESHRDHGLGLDTLARFLHAFNAHYGDTDERTRDRVAYPHFDLAESDTCYTIYGELPGLGGANVSVEIDDQQSILTVSGLLKRSFPDSESPDPGVKIVRHEPPPGTEAKKIESRDNNLVASHVEEQDGTGDSANQGARKTRDGKMVENKEQLLHWHVTERDVGHFCRTFQFPVQLADISSASASIRKGLLCVTMPKKRMARRVEIE
ncbi:hypothetical protein B0H63DRAFT_449676 [Podospora didyma]|uniref:SHSP domain-containing protein n=1 Tax=Podospora didyma TaxID=330526 RepID=A0AAE0NQJ8_9PEZI|nr:hypothetical protein B0H63DRAFT_449676 [Podospora didyma]